MRADQRDTSTIGNGSTAAAVREELRTGLPVGDKYHSQKAEDAIVFLQKWLNANQTALSNDRLAAENLIRDMKNALNGY